MKDDDYGLKVWLQMRKVSVTLKIGQLKHENKMQREQSGKRKKNFQKLWGTFKRCNIYMVGIPNGEEVG